MNNMPVMDDTPGKSVDTDASPKRDRVKIRLLIFYLFSFFVVMPFEILAIKAFTSDTLQNIFIILLLFNIPAIIGLLITIFEKKEKRITYLHGNIILFYICLPFFWVPYSYLFFCAPLITTLSSYIIEYRRKRLTFVWLHTLALMIIYCVFTGSALYIAFVMFLK